MEEDEEDPPMSTISRHAFGDFYVDIIENMQEDYGMFVWPCSIVLMEYVWQQRLHFSGTTVVELGAGTSLPGLVAAKVGSDVILTDGSNRLEVQDNMRRICDLNKLNCKVMGLSWGEWDSSLFSLEPKIVLGADVLYDTNDFDDLFATVTFLLQNSLGSVFITTYHNRSGHHLIEYLMVKWGLKCTKLLDAFSFMPRCKSASLHGNIQLAEITLDIQQPKAWRRWTEDEKYSPSQILLRLCLAFLSGRVEKSSCCSLLLQMKMGREKDRRKKKGRLHVDLPCGQSGLMHIVTIGSLLTRASFFVVDPSHLLQLLHTYYG